MTNIFQKKRKAKLREKNCSITNCDIWMYLFKIIKKTHRIKNHTQIHRTVQFTQDDIKHGRCALYINVDIIIKF